MKRTILLFLTVIIILSLCAISYAEKGKHVAKDGAQMQTDTPATPTRMPPENETTILLDSDDNEGETPEMQMMIDETPVTVAWEENESVAALKELAQNGLTIQTSMYGGFEQVGAIGQRLPRSDEQTSTSSGDIVLYSGDQLVVFYGQNSWAYTRLGRIADKTPEELKTLLGNGDVTITLTTR